MPQTADYSANFTNPAYVTPEALAAARAYADVLTKRSGQEVNRPTGAIGNMLNAFTAALTRNNANAQQSEAAEGNARNISDLVSQQQAGEKLDPSNLGHIAANPMASPEARAMAHELIAPKAVSDAFGRPAYASPAAGVQAAPINGPYQPGYRVEQGAQGVHSNAPFPAPPIGGQPVASTPKSWGTKEGEAAGIYEPSSRQPAAPNQPLTLDALAAKGREFEAQRTFTQGGAEAQTGIAKQDIDSAAVAPTIKRVAGTMLDDLRTHGDKMTFGPTAEWSNNVKRIAANYAPGMMKSQLEGLASADSFDKMSAQLTSLIARGSGGTDAQLFNNMRSVPGSHNSREGAEALLKMTLQVADQQQALRQATGHARNAQEYEAARSQFFAQNPIINPITGNPIAQDLQRPPNEGGAAGGGARIIGVRPAR